MKPTLTSFLTSIADAVRAKTGKTGPIAALSLPNEIFAINLTPTLLGKVFDCGSFKLTQNKTNYTVTHNLGHTPDNLILFASYNTAAVKSITAFCSRIHCGNAVNGSIFNLYFGTHIKFLCLTDSLSDISYESTCTAGNGCFSSFSANAFTVSVPSDAPLSAGITYSWIVW